MYVYRSSHAENNPVLYKTSKEKQKEMNSMKAFYRTNKCKNADIKGIKESQSNRSLVWSFDQKLS